MARKRNVETIVVENYIEFRDPPDLIDRQKTKSKKQPPNDGQRLWGAWANTLFPLTKRGAKGRWAMVREFNEPKQAWAAQDHLTRRKVIIPYPDHNWEFQSRGCELFAIYRGPLPTSRKKAPNGRRKKKK